MPSSDLRHVDSLNCVYPRFTRSLIVVISLISFFTLFGWAFGIDFLKSPFPGIIAMNPTSAVFFLVVSFCVFSLTTPRQARRKLVMAVFGFLLPGLLTVAGIAILTQNFHSKDYGLDSLIFRDEIHALAAKPGSGRMGPFASLNFTISGIVIMLIASGQSVQQKSANILSLIILLVAVFSLTGYIYNVEEFYLNHPYKPMAVQTSTSFILVGLVLLFLNSRAGFMRIVSDAHGGGFIARMMLPAAILVPVLMGYIRLRFQWAFPVSVELGVNFLISGIVVMFIVLILYVAREINTKDRLTAEAEGKLAVINERLEQKVIERTAALYSNEKRSKALIENSFDVVALYDSQMRLTYLSPSFERLTGFSVQHRMLLNGLSFAHPDDQETSRALIRKVLGTPNVPVPFQNRLLHRKGHYIWVEGVLTNLLSDSEVQSIVSNYREVTERKEAEEKLKASEVKFRSLIENSFDAIALFNQNGDVTYFSPSAERMTGIMLQESQVTQAFQLVHHDDTKALEKLFNDSLSNAGMPIPFQCRIQHAQGYYIWTEGVITNLLNDNNIGSIVANFRDVTERRRHEAKLEETNRQIRDILESSIDCFFTCDREWIVQYWNKAAEEFTQIERARIIGRSIWSIFPLSNQSISFQSLHRTLEEGIPTSFEDCYVNVWFGATVYPSKEGLSVFFRDITERKRVEMLSTLEKEVLKFYTARKKAPLEETFELLLNGVQLIHPEMLCSVLRFENGRLYNWASPHLPTAYSTAIQGLPAGVAEGSCGTAAFRKENVIVADIANDPLWANYRDLAAVYNLSACWSHIILDDDKAVLGTFAIYYRTVRSPTPAELLTIERAYVILKNIIENHVAEERILKLNTDLEDRVKKRTLQLEEVNKELESFSYSVSHDLRAPLRSIHGYSHILKEEIGGLIGETSNRHLDSVINNASRMGALIDDLLNLSRTVKAELKTQRLDMNVIVKEVIEELQSQSLNSPVQWVMGDLQMARCDRSLIKQVWMNLLSNAIKYSGGKTPPIIKIGMDRQDEVITYFVNDNGTGFDMKYYDKLFGAFQRLHAASEFPGTGVGLAIVQRVVRRHGGQTWAESKPNQGATFYFTLPAT